jgi:tRNA dimethylallyltransferase
LKTPDFYKHKSLVLVAGPTAVGKTALCLTLAQHFNTEIVSADSRQFYREMNVGTAKPTPEELAQVHHYLVNSLSIKQNYDVKQFETDALSALDIIFEKSPIAIATGGSGLFIKTLCEGIDEMPSTNPAVRKNLEKQLKTQGIEVLTQQLKILDPEYYQQVDLANPQRVLRALEVCIGTGFPYSSFRKDTWKMPISPKRPFSIIRIGLERERAELYERINQRVDEMLANGLLEEARHLYPYRHQNALQTVGYQEIFGYLEQKYHWEEAVRLIKRNTRRYAKRQLTWFRKDTGIHWFRLSNHATKDFQEIRTFIEGNL